MESHLFGNLRKWEAGKRDSGAINIAQMHLQMGHKSELIILILCYHIIYFTRSYAALRAADLDWIVRPGYSLGRVHSGEKP